MDVFDVQVFEHHVTFSLKQGDRVAFVQYARTDIIFPGDIGGAYEIRNGAEPQYVHGYHSSRARPAPTFSEVIESELRRHLPKAKAA